MLQNFAIRMGFLVVLSLTVFGIGKIANIVSPPEHSGPTIPFAETSLAAPLSDPIMARAMDELNARHGTSGGGMGARMTFPSPSGSVTLYADEVYSLNQRYRQMAAHDAAMSAHQDRMLAIEEDREEMERYSLDEGDWGVDTGY
ncbi:MAG: hypothetical protein SXU28_09935 [Pseudomonadota bacterium]|nr:hypothetical protein [Pseudomonadota bacterium]